MIATDIQAYALLIMVLKAEAPYDTGRLSQRGIRMISNEKGMHIKIGHNSDPNFADYAVYTNEPWINRSGINPNEGWIDKAISRAIPLITQVYEGMDIDEYNELMDNLQLEYVTNKVRAHGGKGLR